MAAVFAVVLTVALVFASPLSAPRGTDYAAGSQLAQQLQTDYETADAGIDDMLTFLYSSTPFEQRTARALTTKSTALRRDVEAFGQLRVNHDDAVADAYDSYRRQALHYAAFADDLAQSAQLLNQTAQACSEQPAVSTSDDQLADTFKPYVAACHAAAERLSDAPSTLVTEFGSTVLSNLDAMNTLVTQIEDVTSGNAGLSWSERAARLKELNSQLVDLDFSSGAVPAFQTRLDNARHTADPSEALTRLQQALRRGAGA